jgi:hypothetical protein
VGGVMASDNWTPGERFALLRYTHEGVTKLKSELEGRSEVAIKSMARKLDMADCYVKQKNRVSYRKFCNDCRFDNKTCGESIRDCLKKANLYKKYSNMSYKEQKNIEVKPKIKPKKNTKFVQTKMDFEEGDC